MRSFTMLTLAAALALATVPALACDGAKQGAKRAEAQAQALAEADSDGNGTLSADEFAGYKAAMERARASHMFSKLDADNDGQVTADELAAAPGPRH